MGHPTIPPAAPAVLALAPYQSARMLNAFDPSKIYLDANELPFPPEEAPLDFSELQHYAHSGPRQMISSYADYACVPAENIIATRGIDEGIDLLIRAYLEPGQDAVLTMSPTYGMYEVCASAHRVQTIDLPLINLADPDIDGLSALDAFPKLIFLCRPNNPTGTLMSREAVETVLEMSAGRAIVAVDEAYIEFCAEESLIPLLSQYPNLVILRTLSKGFGLAGLHTGFLLAHPEITDAVNRIANPYPIPEPCAQIALNALSQPGLNRLNANIDSVLAERDRLLGALNQQAACTGVLPSNANFLLSTWRNPEQALTALTAKNILVRPVKLGGENEVRIRFSIGSRAQNDQVIAALSSGFSS